MDELAAYFYERVLSPMVRYEETKHDGEIGGDRDVRAALDAATSLYHLREHIPPPYQKTRRSIATTCPEYDLLGDVVNASKHGNLTRGTPQVSSVNDIYQLHVCTKYRDNEGEYVHEEKRVMVKLSDGTEHDLFDVLISVFDFWVRELSSIGANPARHQFSNPPTGLIARDDAKQVQLQITAGIRWKHHFRFQKYDYDEEQIVAMDFSDAEDIIFSLREPPIFEIELRSSEGVFGSCKLRLTPDQARKLDHIEGEAEREAYLLGIAEKNGLQQKLVTELLQQRSGVTRE